MVALNKNYIEVEIGGRVRKVKMAMVAMQKIGDMVLSNPDDLINPFTRSIKACMIGIDLPENELPEGFNEAMLIEWIDDMVQEDWDAVDEFISTALGFIMQTLNKKLEMTFGKPKEEEAA